MAVYSINKIQKIPITLDEAWIFFSNPANLQLLTPDTMNFRVISKLHGDRMYAGQIIEYKLKPLMGITMYWMTEITHVQEHLFFVDEQRFGPYRLWHHQHLFRKIDGGVEMTDIVHYKNPLWFLGDLANWLFVKKKLRHIFDYRFKKVEELFGKWPS
ncbi:MAG TPA: SRPBCC family protein [Chitinophagaceae bacterium]|jgi:ligand-binding SRPBCC domain-containing protein|nr:SRPBCC family protein [Chitinophagaceae bacterium]